MERAHIIRTVSEALAAIPDVEAAWQEGSEAFGRTDELSDIDIIVVVDGGAVERVLDAVEQSLDRLGGIAVAYRAPPPDAGGLPECYYRLAGTPEHLVIDLAFVPPEEVEGALDPLRHGVPHILFDRTGRMRPADDPAIAGHLAARLASLRGRVAVTSHLPAKQLARGKIVEAYDFWQRFLIAPLVEVLRARYAPRRQDFGLRYLDIDLPADVYARLLALLFVNDGMALGGAVAATRTWLEQELAALPDPACAVA
jgi:hypothetical protein